MSSQCEPETNDVRQEQQDSCKPAVGADGLQEERVMNSRDLRIVTAATVSILRVLDNTGMAIELVLVVVSNVITCRTCSDQTHTTVDLVE